MLKKIMGMVCFGAGFVCVMLLLQACYFDTVSQPNHKAQSTVSPQTVDVNSSELQKYTQLPNAPKKTTKPGASVTILNQQPIILHSVGLHDLEIVLHSPGSHGELSVAATSSKGIRITSMVNPMVFPMTEGGEYRLPISINIQHEGRHYIHLNVSVTVNNIIQKRAISVILQAGKTQFTLQKAMPTDNSDTVIELPAQEKVSSPY
jgi:hypothetical protein